MSRKRIEKSTARLATLAILAGSPPAILAATVPGAPTIGKATAGNAQASVAFTAPASNGGSAITAYTASCTGAGVTQTGTGKSSPIVVSGLRNGSLYSCKVQARNAMGSGAVSGAVTVMPATVPGMPTIGKATAGNAQVSVAFTAPASNGGSAITAYTASCIGAGVTQTGTGKSSPIVVSGLSNGLIYSCKVQARNAMGSGAASGAALVTPVAGTSTSGGTTGGTTTNTTSTNIYAPAGFDATLARSYQAPSLVSAATLASRSRYLISDSPSASTSANYLAIGSTYSATTGYAVESSTIPTASTYNSYLSKLVQAVSNGDGYFRLDAHLHPNQSIDCDVNDSNRLKFRNNFGKAKTTYGYVTFSYDSSTKLLQARKRYKYSYDATTYAATYTEDATFAGANQYVSYAGGAYKLVPSASSATRLYLYASPIDFGIPLNMNPAATAYVSNANAPFKTKISPEAVEGSNGQIYKNVNATYQSQVKVAGSSAETKASADAFLATIKTTLASKGEKLRYDPAVYTAFRDAALATKLVSDAVADGTPGQNLVPYVYFTNEQDSSGNYHPFMIVVSYGNPSSPHGLQDIPRPPGEGGVTYPNARVTRYSNLENYILSIPLKDYGLVSAVTENTLARTLLSDMGLTTASANVYNYASVADNGVLINGAVMFPVMNNTLVPSQSMGELSANGCHVGQGGGGPHCHADGYQSSKGVGVAVYGDSDYVGKTHPPLIGFGYDGVALFGVYRASDSAMLGYGTALDNFGGHLHDNLAYHYHAHSVPNYPLAGSNITYTLNVLMKGAYIGKTNGIPFFGVNSNFSNNKYLGGTVK